MTLADDLQLQQRVLDELAFDPKIHAAHIGVTADVYKRQSLS